MVIGTRADRGVELSRIIEAGTRFVNCERWGCVAVSGRRSEIGTEGDRDLVGPGWEQFQVQRTSDGAEPHHGCQQEVRPSRGNRIIESQDRDFRHPDEPGKVRRLGGTLLQ